MPDKSDITRLHQDEDLKATGLAGQTDARIGFKHHALINSDMSHSIGVRPHPHGSAIAKGLLGLDKIKTVQIDETRPLIDRFQEATFSDPVGLQWIEDKYALRSILRKAHCFTVDAATSAMTAQFSVAIAADIESARHLAVPPFPVTWFELDNHARLAKSKELIGLTPMAAGVTHGEPVPTVGWLIVTTGPDEYAAIYCAEVEQSILTAPVAWCWTTSHEPSRQVASRSKHWLDRMIFGMPETNCNINGAWLGSASFQRRRIEPSGEQAITPQELELLTELSGELRHIFGLLIALGAGQLGAETVTAPQALPAGPPPMAKGKPILPLEHKVLTIRLGRRTTVEKVAMRAITGIKHRFHDVRGHFRTKRNSDGSIKWRIPIKPHTRGDERLGKIEKTYRVEK